MRYNTVNSFSCLLVLLYLIIGSVSSLFLVRSKNSDYNRRAIARQSRELAMNEVDNLNIETFSDLVRRENYDVEEHDVTTEDGYILTIHRIPSGPKSPATYGKPVVLLMHGLFASSTVWVVQGAHKDLAYLLVDNGYDVWALNTRGNIYGRRHERLSPDDAKFWRFSWHEFGVYDTAATIDYLLSLTGQSQVSLVGHSMGGTVQLALLSKRPEYNSKVNVVLAFAPVALVTHKLPGLFVSIGLQYGNRIEEALRLLSRQELFPRLSESLINYSKLCQTPRGLPVCRQMVLYLLGLTNFEEFDITMLPRLLHHYPQGTSMETLIHYRQIAISGQFREYDFGAMGNLFKYKSLTPPEYSMDKISVPCYLYYGPYDGYVTKGDVEAIAAKLPKSTIREISYPRFSHLDFIFSNNSRELVYYDTLEIVNKFNLHSNATQNVINV